MRIVRSTGSFPDNIEKLKKALAEADAVVIGAGAGLSTSAGFVYSGERFERWFSDFGKKYGFSEMYTGGFRVMELPPEEMWAYWSRYIWVNRYMDAPKPLYQKFLGIVKDKDYFVLTTNVDHCFQKAGFDNDRLFYTQGDYGLWQCSEPCHDRTYDNEETVRAMLEAQGFIIAEDGTLTVPEGAELKMTASEGTTLKTAASKGTTLKTAASEGTPIKMAVPTELLPTCPVCGKPMTMNLRSDDRFVEDDGWHRAAERYESFIRTRRGRVLFLELGVGYNTPGIIKIPFWNMTAANSKATYACINFSEAVCPEQIKERSICLEGDAWNVLSELE